MIATNLFFGVRWPSSSPSEGLAVKVLLTVRCVNSCRTEYALCFVASRVLYLQAHIQWGTSCNIYMLIVFGVSQDIVHGVIEKYCYFYVCENSTRLSCAHPWV